MFRLAILVLVLPMIIFAEAPEEEGYSNYRQPYRASIRHIEGRGIGYNQGYTTLEGFFAADPEELGVMPFLDVRGHLFDNGKAAANAGIGLRKIDGCYVYGLNAYYDYRNVRKTHYNQLGLGFEMLGDRWDFRINGYLPVGKKSSAISSSAFSRFSGHYLFLTQKHQFAMKGADAELGWRFGTFRNLDLYAAAGPYYFNGLMGPKVWGGKGRLAAKYKDYVTLEVSNSYDRMFHNNFQFQFTFTVPFGGRSSECQQSLCNTCYTPDVLISRMMQPVEREEIIVVGKKNRTSIAIDPATGLPYFFVFVDNTSSSDGTYESPYHSLVQAQDNSSPYDIIYVFPGDGTTRGMNSGIALQASQKLWGSGVSHLLQTTAGTISIPQQSSSSPTITNTNIDTEGNAVTLATNNAISGFTITSALNDAIYGTDPQSLDVSLCTFENTNTFAIEASFSGNASISVRNNQFLNNVNGVFLTLNGTSSLDCSDNIFKGQTSVSETPITVVANNNSFSARIENNLFDSNTTGSVRFGLNNTVNADITLLNNTMTNNGTGFQSSLGSSVVLLSTGTIGHCAVALDNNVFAGNTSNSLYAHTSGQMTNFELTATKNTMSDNGGSALVLATPVDNLTLLATENAITGVNDNGIAVIASGSTSMGDITINNNSITNVGNASNGVAVNQDFTTLNLTLLNNTINNCEGTGILSYAPTGIDSLTLNVSGNTISNCQNLSSNAAAGLDIEQYNNLSGSIMNNTMLNNPGLGVFIGSMLTSPSACLEMEGNTNNTGYLLTSGSGVLNLAPCDVETVNSGAFTLIGTTSVQSCPAATPCPP